jgi:6-phosphogluconolactonase
MREANGAEPAIPQSHGSGCGRALIDADKGKLTRRADIAALGGPSVTAISPDRKTLYVASRTQPSIANYRIDPATGDLSLLGTASQADAPTFLAPDRTGRYMLCAYYQGGYVAVYPIAADGTIGAAAVDKQETAVGAHAIGADPSNCFAFVPHIARIQVNVLEPPKNTPGPNVILQYRFDAQTGRLSSNTPHRVEQGGSDRTPPLRPSPESRRRLFFERTGLQRHRLSARPRDRHPFVRADDLDSARRSQ